MSEQLNPAGILRALAAVNAGAKQGRTEGLGLAGHHVLGVSNAQVPHEEGDFERGGATGVDGNRVGVGYRDTAYRGQAETLHEDMTLRHDSGRNAKFLENAMNSERDTALQILAESIRKGMGL